MQRDDKEASLLTSGAVIVSKFVHSGVSEPVLHGRDRDRLLIIATSAAELGVSVISLAEYIRACDPQVRPSLHSDFSIAHLSLRTSCKRALTRTLLLDLEKCRDPKSWRVVKLARGLRFQKVDARSQN
jgi:hypothetical protein